MDNAPADRQWLVRHALRSAVKRGDPEALAVLGFAGGDALIVRNARISPERVAVGDSVTLTFELANTGQIPQRVLVDFAVLFVKANGRTSPKVFKLTTVELAPGDSALLSKSLSLVQRTTRKHYPGLHRIEAMLNGVVAPLGSFELEA
ncbi:MAG: hypothetical protein SH809_20000 [Rhodothermales bacterium]|nr:hypothetical protein [Rhodothermales bacterium]